MDHIWGDKTAQNLALHTPAYFMASRVPDLVGGGRVRVRVRE